MDNLRQKAKLLLKDKETSFYSNTDLNKLIHELDVYQAELEAQNRELLEKEQKLLESQEELSILFMDAPIAYIVLDNQFNITKFNKKASIIFNFKTTVFKSHFYSFFKELKDIDQFLKWLKEDGILRLKIKDRFKNIKTVELEHVNSNINNNDIYLISVKDITQEIEHKEKIQMYDSILDELPVCIIITDNNAKIIYINREVSKYTKYEKEEIIGKDPSIFKSGFTSKEEYDKLWKTIRNGETWHGIFKNLTKDKKIHWLATAITPIFNEKNQIVKYISVETNIDEKVKMENVLKKQEEIMLIQARHAAMGEMISMIAHQWRQPLSLISTIASSLILKYELDTLDIKNDFKDLNHILSTTYYLSQTIDDFSNFFKKDKVLNSTNAKEIIEKVLSILNKSLDNNNISVKVNNLSEININSYTNEILQVFINLLNNSKDALVKNDNIDKIIYLNVHDDDNNETLIFTINDNAGGIPENIIDQIFDPYFTTKESKNGTGIGLYIVKTIVEKHLRGKINVANNKLGAIFTLEIPNIQIT